MNKKSTGLKESVKKNENMILSFIGVLGFFLIWQLLLEFGMIPDKYLSKPTEVVSTFLTKLTDPRPEGATLIENILSSLKVALSGFFLAMAAGIPLGLLMGWYPVLDRLVRPCFEILRPIPPVAWIPLTILWLGIGLGAKSFIIFFAAFIPCVINSYAGIKQTSQSHINVAKTCGASNWQIFLNVGAAWATLVAAEMLAANAGLGFMIGMGRSFARPDLIVMGMLVIGLIGAFLSFVLTMIERKFAGWRMEL